MCCWDVTHLFNERVHFFPQHLVSICNWLFLFFDWNFTSRCLSVNFLNFEPCYRHILFTLSINVLYTGLKINEKIPVAILRLNTKILSQFSNFWSQNLRAAFSYQRFRKTKYEPAILVCVKKPLKMAKDRNCSCI